MSNQWVIRAPKLRTLVITDGFDHGWQISDLPSLEVARIECTSDHDFDKLITGAAYARDLEINIPPTEVDVLEKLPFLFENLRRLSVTVNFCKTCNIFSMFCLLRSAPVLEELDVWAWSDGTQKIEANNEFLKAQCADQTFAKLHVVRMKMLSYLANEMLFMEYVLSEARILQVFYVTLQSYASCSNEEVVTEIAQYSRASPDAEVIFMGREPVSSNDEYRGLITWMDEDCTDEAQTNEARPRRRQRRNFESVAQVDQLEEEILKLAKKRDQIAMDSLGASKETNVILKECRKQQKYSDCAMQLLCERYNMNYWELLQRKLQLHASSCDRPGTSNSKPGGSSVDTDDDCSTDIS